MGVGVGVGVEMGVGVGVGVGVCSGVVCGARAADERRFRMALTAVPGLAEVGVGVDLGARRGGNPADGLEGQGQSEGAVELQKTSPP